MSGSTQEQCVTGPNKLWSRFISTSRIGWKVWKDWRHGIYTPCYMGRHTQGATLGMNPVLSRRTLTYHTIDYAPCVVVAGNHARKVRVRCSGSRTNQEHIAIRTAGFSSFGKHRTTHKYSTSTVQYTVLMGYAPPVLLPSCRAPCCLFTGLRTYTSNPLYPLRNTSLFLPFSRTVVPTSNTATQPIKDLVSPSFSVALCHLTTSCPATPATTFRFWTSLYSSIVVQQT